METIGILGIIVGILGTSGYVFLCVWLVRAWQQCPETQSPEDFQPATRISVLIPARNEAAGIAACINSILRQDYPPELYEVIVIDDHSEDQTAEIVNSYKDLRIKLIRLADFSTEFEHLAFKKQALTAGVRFSDGSLLVQTDADCTAPPLWLKETAFYHENNGAPCILGAVHFIENENILGRFQALEMTGMMLVTAALANAGKPWLANGANLAYTRKAFETVEGYTGQTHLASGDDMMLVHRIGRNYPGKVVFLKNRNLAVETGVQPDWQSFLSQRIRWATKTNSYSEKSITIVLGGIFLFCIAGLTMIFGGLVLGMQTLLLAGLASFLGKALADYYLLSEACRFYHREQLLRKFWITEIMHTLYIVFAGVMGLTRRKYEWKGRRVQ